MFSYVKLELSDRIREINMLFVQIKSLNNQMILCKEKREFFAQEELLNSLKGILFILLYGCIENVVTNTVKRTEYIITAQEKKLSEYKKSLFPRFLCAEFDTLHNVGRKQKWQKRLDFMHKIISDETITSHRCADLELPTDGSNIKTTQLASIFAIFGISTNILTPYLNGRLRDIVNHRNAIAHGNQTASSIGKKIFVSDLEKRINEINSFCTEYITIFEQYILNEDYLSK